MADLQMTDDERQQFLADLHVGVLGIERADGPPLVVPVWYDYNAGGDVEVYTGADSLKGRLAAAAARGSLCAQTESLPYKYVTVEGPVMLEPLVEADLEKLSAMAIRYLGEELGAGYAAGQSIEGQVRLRLWPQRWLSVDYGRQF
ncbi:MAG: pyridoxamine 5'-phosphate oxidase family protein [Ilumatobacteraceae bacterium]|nr:pyridoxamine 5'-phosphate oxidase family protein [Ilumatobacteraceae bacterium]